MKIKAILVAAALVLSVVQAKAQIPYGNVGTVAPTNVFKATTTGDITGYFVQGGYASGGGAGDLDFVGMLDVTTNTFSGWEFNNQTSLAGDTANFGSANAGDVLEFLLENTSITSFNNISYPSGIILSSIPADSVDGVNHAYSTSWAGGTLNGASIPAGTYVGMEDLPVPDSDLNYNDDSFVFAGVAETSATPEPSSFMLLGTGLLGLIEFGRRKLRG